MDLFLLDFAMDGWIHSFVGGFHQKSFGKQGDTMRESRCEKDCLFRIVFITIMDTMFHVNSDHSHSILHQHNCQRIDLCTCTFFIESSSTTNTISINQRTSKRKSRNNSSRYSSTSTYDIDVNDISIWLVSDLSNSYFDHSNCDQSNPLENLLTSSSIE